jgi:predicted ATPase
MDAERKQTFEEAEATHQVMIETYSALGYEMIPLPLDSVQERVKFLLSSIS